jgi:hypothetical protein
MRINEETTAAQNGDEDNQENEPNPHACSHQIPPAFLRTSEFYTARLECAVNTLLRLEPGGPRA